MKKLIASLQSTFVFLLSTYMLLFICKQGVRASTAHLSPELYFCLVFILTGFDFFIYHEKEIDSTQSPKLNCKKLIRYNLYYLVNMRTSKLTSFYFDKIEGLREFIYRMSRHNTERQILRILYLGIYGRYEWLFPGNLDNSIDEQSWESHIRSFPRKSEQCDCHRTNGRIITFQPPSVSLVDITQSYLNQV